MKIADLVNPEPTAPPRSALPEPASPPELKASPETKARRPPKMRGKPGKRHECPKSGCGSSFTRNSDLTRHLKIHEGIRPHECPEPGCGKCFSQSSALKVHLRTHTGERPHKCDDCSQSFGDSSSLARHRRMHTGELSYICTHGDCTRAYARKVTLTKHIAKVHNGVPGTPSSPRPAQRGGGRPSGRRARSLSFSDVESSPSPSPTPSLNDQSEDDSSDEADAAAPSPPGSPRAEQQRTMPQLATPVSPRLAVRSRAPSVVSSQDDSPPASPLLLSSFNGRRGPVVGLGITLAAPPMLRSVSAMSTHSAPGCLESPIDASFAGMDVDGGAAEQTPARPVFTLPPLPDATYPRFAQSPVAGYTWPTPQDYSSPRFGRFDMPPPVSPTSTWYTGPSPMRYAFAYRMPPAGFYTPLSPMTPSFNASIYRREAAPSPISPEYAPWSR